MPTALLPIPVVYVPDAQLPEGREVISITNDFSVTPSLLIDLSSVRSTRPFSGVKGLYIEFEDMGPAMGPVQISIASTGQIINLDSASRSCAAFPLTTTPWDKITFTGAAGVANIVLTNFEVQPFRYRS
jgi:hypothetical protein